METQLRVFRLMRLLESVLLPPVCCLCGLKARGGGLDLCERCRESLPAAPQGAQDPGGAEGPLAAQYSAQFATQFDRVLIPYVYRYPVDHFVRGLKFRGERRYARVLGILIAQAHARTGHATPSALVPLPLHIARLRQRGFNQAQVLAQYAAAALGIPVEHSLLVRSRATTEQSRLDLRRRHLNVLGAFAVRAPPEGAHVAIVDDVVTTGSTAREAAFALRQAGVRRVELWAAARALTQRNSISTYQLPPFVAPHAGRPASGCSPPDVSPG